MSRDRIARTFPLPVLIVLLGEVKENADGTKAGRPPAGPSWSGTIGVREYRF